MPHVVAGLETRPFMRIVEDAAIGHHIADGAEILDHAFLAELHMARLRLTKGCCDGELMFVIEWLVGETQERIVVDRGSNFFRHLVRQRFAKIDTGDAGAEIRVNFLKSSARPWGSLRKISGNRFKHQMRGTPS